MRAGAIILAAGAATRMGCVKQLLPWAGRTLVEHAIQQAVGAGFAPVVVVLGAQAAAVGEAVGRSSAACVVNEGWEAGMGSSIRCGVGKMLEMAADVEAIAVMLADQPLVGAAELMEMRRVFEGGGAPILAACYAGTVGVPAIFGRSVFQALRELAAEAGARALLRGADVGRFELPEAAVDVDTPEDFAAVVGRCG